MRSLGRNCSLDFVTKTGNIGGLGFAVVCLLFAYRSLSFADRLLLFAIVRQLFAYRLLSFVIVRYCSPILCCSPIVHQSFAIVHQSFANCCQSFTNRSPMGRKSIGIVRTGCLSNSRFLFACAPLQFPFRLFCAVRFSTIPQNLDFNLQKRIGTTPIAIQLMKLGLHSHSVTNLSVSSL